MCNVHDPEVVGEWPPREASRSAWFVSCFACGAVLRIHAPTWFLAREGARHWLARFGHKGADAEPVPGVWAPSVDDAPHREDLAALDVSGGVGILMRATYPACVGAR